MGYRYQYRTRVSADGVRDLLPSPWDVFVSAYNESARVQSAWSQVQARRKIWLVQGEYRYTDLEISDISGEKLVGGSAEPEALVAHRLLESCRLSAQDRVCVDITRFMRHNLLAVIRLLYEMGLERVWYLYSDPGSYMRDERTGFSVELTTVTDVAGYSGSHDAADVNQDWIVLGTGYDTAAIAQRCAISGRPVVSTFMDSPHSSRRCIRRTFCRWLSWRTPQGLGLTTR